MKVVTSLTMEIAAAPLPARIKASHYMSCALMMEGKEGQRGSQRGEGGQQQCATERQRRGWRRWSNVPCFASSKSETRDPESRLVSLPSSSNKSEEDPGRCPVRAFASLMLLRRLRGELEETKKKLQRTRRLTCRDSCPSTTRPQQTRSRGLSALRVCMVTPSSLKAHQGHRH